MASKTCVSWFKTCNEHQPTSRNQLEAPYASDTLDVSKLCFVKNGTELCTCSSLAARSSMPRKSHVQNTKTLATSCHQNAQICSFAHASGEQNWAKPPITIEYHWCFPCLKSTTEKFKVMHNSNLSQSLSLSLSMSGCSTLKSSSGNFLATSPYATPKEMCRSLSDSLRFSQLWGQGHHLVGVKVSGPGKLLVAVVRKQRKNEKNESMWKRTKTASDFTWILFCILSSRGCKTKAQVARWEIVSEWNGYLTMRLFCRMKASIGWCHFLDLHKAPAPRLQPLSLRQRSTNCLSRKVHWGCGNQDPNMFRYHTCAEPLHIITTSGRQQPVLLAKSPKAFRMCQWNLPCLHPCCMEKLFVMKRYQIKRYQIDIDRSSWALVYGHWLKQTSCLLECFLLLVARPLPLSVWSHFWISVETLPGSA